jgi:hypothetical protein
MEQQVRVGSSRRETAGRVLGGASGLAVVALTGLAAYFGWEGFHHGDETSVGLLATLAGIWVARIVFFRAAVLRGRTETAVLKGARLGRNLLALPLWLAAAYYGPFVERIGKAAVFFLPERTYDGLRAIDFPGWLAILGTVVAAPVELMLAAVFCTVFVIAPLRAVLGEDNLLVQFLAEHLPNVRMEGGEAAGDEAPAEQAPDAPAATRV